MSPPERRFSRTGAMVFDRMEQTPGLRLLFTLAVVVVLIYGLRLTQPVLLPFAIAAFLAVTSMPIVGWLTAKRVPLPIAILATVAVVAGVFGLLAVLSAQQFSELQARIPAYAEALQLQFSGLLGRLEGRWVLFGDLRADVMGLLNFGVLVSWAGVAFRWAVSFVSTTFLVFLILAFALGEAAVLPRKLRVIGGGGGASGARMQKIVREVQRYLVIKTLVSLATGVLLGSWTWVTGVESPVLLGLVAFGLNYVPTIGSILASLPALALAVVQFDFEVNAVTGFDVQAALVVGLGYLGVNMVLGNWLEPILMGRSLGLSTMFVVFSLIFWGWLWGPVGALLSVPLTMIVKIMLENTQDLKWVAVLLDKAPPPDGPGLGGGRDSTTTVAVDEDGGAASPA